ncbi:MAG TPA: hypothetical protein DDW50_03930 [Firmicutes bacterium]|jgi:hypothetical protein|nr:hypothetical protein [Bacillota bacterium]
MMEKQLVFSKAVTTSVDPQRAIRNAEECLLEVRLVENFKTDTTWLYEYEIKGEFGKIEKFLERLKKLGTIEKVYSES